MFLVLVQYSIVAIICLQYRSSLQCYSMLIKQMVKRTEANNLNNYGFMVI